MGDLSVQIQAAVGAFAAESQQQGRRLRDLLDASPQAFLAVARGMLMDARDTPETRYVVALLSSRGLLLGLLKELAHVDSGAAGAVAQIAQRMDPGFERMLERSVLEAREAGAEDPEFLLGVLEALTGGLNLLPLMGQLRHSGDSRVRSKLAAMLGKMVVAHDWFDGLRADPDPRVRANAIESLWGLEGAFAEACFRHALEDPHHRVVTTALVGLYQQGNVESVRRLAGLSGHPDAAFRAAAAWAMGRTGDPRYLPLLKSMRRQGGGAPAVLRNCVQSISRITHGLAAAKRQAAAVRILEAGAVAGPDGGVWESVTVLARDAGAGGLPELAATAWSIEADGSAVWEYAVERLEAAEKMACCFLLPAGAAEAVCWQEAVDGFLRFRRKDDVGAVQYYWEDQMAQEIARAGEILKIGENAPLRRKVTWEVGELTGAEARLRAVAAKTPEARNLPEGPLGVLVPLTELLEQVQGGRQIFLVLDRLQRQVWDETELAEAEKALRARGVVLHGIASPSTALEAKAAFGKLCRQSGGLLLEASTREGMMRDVADAVASRYRRYRLSFPSAAAGRRRVEVQGCGYAGSAEWHQAAGVAAA